MGILTSGKQSFWGILCQTLTAPTRGALKFWHVIPTGALFSFFLLLETTEKLTKNDFSSVAAKRGIYTQKIFISVDLLLDMKGHNNKQKCS
jgi:hypothetical protein